MLHSRSTGREVVTSRSHLDIPTSSITIPCQLCRGLWRKPDMYMSSKLTWTELQPPLVVQPSHPCSQCWCFSLTHSEGHRYTRSFQRSSPVKDASRSPIAIQTRPPNVHSTELCVGVTRVSNSHYVVLEDEYVGTSSVVHLVLHKPLLSQAYAALWWRRWILWTKHQGRHVMLHT